MSGDPRYANRSLRQKYRARFKAMGLPCHICGGEIDYSAPSNWKYPKSFVIDEIIPVSRWKEFGYDSPQACCNDPNNVAPAHYACNQAKGNKLPNERRTIILKNKSDGDW